MTGDPARAANDAVEPGNHPHATGILRILVAATFVVILNETIMVNAIPRLMHEFAVDARAAQWLSTAFMLTLAVVIPMTGWFLQRVTTRVAFTAALSLFLAGTVLATAAWTFPVLLVARVVQASGTAVMMPLLMTTLLTVVPPHRRGAVMGNVTLAIAVAPALGPAVSGLLLQLGSWRFIFAVVVPIAAAMLVVGLRMLVNVGSPERSRLDVVSILLAALGFGGFVYGLSQVGADPSAGGLPAAPTIAGGLVLVAAFAWRQLRLQRSGTPLLDLRTLGFRTFTLTLTLMCLSFMALMGVMITLPMFLQSVHGMSPLATGLLLMPGGLVMGLLGPKVGSLFDRYGARALVVPGATLMLGALVGFATIGTGTPAWWLLTLHVLMSVALALIFTPVFTAGLAVLPAHLYAHGSAVLSTLQQVAAAIGTAVVVTILSVRAASLAGSGVDPVSALSGGIQWGMGFGAVIGVGVLVLAFFVPSGPPVDADNQIDQADQADQAEQTDHTDAPQDEEVRA
ncbi:MAG: DHA2 family efflux MFS transporter permease subunit [Actinomycetota bacterium]|nr:DHA2 family efflux MFS transporter permease subunit [Actinomycetota bacterium]